MRAIVIFGGSRRLGRLADGVATGLREVGFDVTLHEAEERPRSVVPVASYDLVCVGASVTSMFGGSITPAVEATLAQCSRIEGKPVGAFVEPRLLGATKALRRLMAELERQGAWVQDFASIRSVNDAVVFGRRLQSLVE